MNQKETCKACAELSEEMRKVMKRGHMDQFNTLARRRNHMLQWLAGTLPDAPDIKGLKGENRPDATTRQKIFLRAIEENNALIQCARFCMQDTRRQIDSLAKRRNSNKKLAMGYSANAPTSCIATRL